MELIRGAEETVIRNVLLLDSEQRLAWDRYLEGYPLYSPLVRWELVESRLLAHGVSTQFFIAFECGEIVGLVPTFHNDSDLYSAKFGLVTNNLDTSRALIDAVDRYCVSHKLRGRIHQGYCDNGSPLCIPSDHQTFTIPIMASEDEQLTSLRRKTRTVIRRDTRSVTTHEGSLSDLLDPFHAIYEQHMKRLGVKPDSKEMFLRLWSLIGKDFKLAVARRDDEIVGGVVVILGKSLAALLYLASEEDNNYSSILIWHCLSLCRAANISVLEMGESVRGSSVHDFKRNFGGESHDVCYRNVGVRPTLASRMRKRLLR